MKLQDFFTEYIIYSPLSRQELEEQLGEARALVEELRQQNQQLRKELRILRDYNQRAIVLPSAISPLEARS